MEFHSPSPSATLPSSRVRGREMNRAAAAGTLLSRLPFATLRPKQSSHLTLHTISQTIHLLLGTGIYSGLYPSQIFDQHGDQTLWK